MTPNIGICSLCRWVSVLFKLLGGVKAAQVVLLLLLSRHQLLLMVETVNILRVLLS